MLALDRLFEHKFISSPLSQIRRVDKSIVIQFDVFEDFLLSCSQPLVRERAKIKLICVGVSSIQANLKFQTSRLSASAITNHPVDLTASRKSKINADISCADMDNIIFRIAATTAPK